MADLYRREEAGAEPAVIAERVQRFIAEARAPPRGKGAFDLSEEIEAVQLITFTHALTKSVTKRFPPSRWA